MLCEISFPDGRATVYENFPKGVLIVDVCRLYEQYGAPFKICNLQDSSLDEYCLRLDNGYVLTMWFSSYANKLCPFTLGLYEQNGLDKIDRLSTEEFKKWWDSPKGCDLSTLFSGR